MVIAAVRGVCLSKKRRKPPIDKPAVETPHMAAAEPVVAAPEAVADTAHAPEIDESDTILDGPH